MMIKTLERVRGWISEHPGTIGSILCVFLLVALLKVCLSSIQYDYQVTNQSVQQWATEHQGTVLNCNNTNHFYYCRVQTHTGVVKLVYDQVGSREPCMIFREF